jgi:nucleotide-binding universal stress UspA family protein
MANRVHLKGGGRFMKILLTTDGSSGALRAQRTAIRVLQSAGREIDLLCVAPEYRSRMTGWEESRQRQRYHQRILAESSRILKDAKCALAADGVEVKTRSEVGSPQGVIVRLSDDYDLTVLGARGRNGGHDEHSEMGLGPVAHHVVQHAPGSVLIGRELRSATGFRVLVPVDGSDGSRRALEQMEGLLDLAGADVTLMTVMETPWLHLGLEQEWFGYDDPLHEKIDPESDWQKNMRAEAERMLIAARDQIWPDHPGIQLEIAEGTPANEILSEAEQSEYDMIVVGATGTTDLKHQLLGSVSSRLAWEAPCSVLIVRATA